jgi:phosphoribosylformylglycinamidine cyclo-ligase
MDYKSAGVDVDLADQLVKYLGMSGYGAVIDLGGVKIVLSTDGVGTKLLVAEAHNKFDTIGIDLVAMCTNDVLCQGARPHSFLDYYATGKLDLEKSKTILDSIIKGCELAGCKLVGGETAEMPGVYTDSRFDLAGFCMGVVEKDLPQSVSVGDMLVGIPSSGPHSNGFSLLRQLLPMDQIPLTPTRIYTNEIMDNIAYIRACSHITGGGIHGNLPRVLNGHDYKLNIDIPADSWWQDVFERSHLSKHEFESTFNCGWGMILVVAQDDIKHLNIVDCQVIGEII